MGSDAAKAGQQGPGAVDLTTDERPDSGGEGPELLNALPAGDDRFQRGGGERPLAAVVEIGLVCQGRHQ